MSKTCTTQEDLRSDGEQMLINPYYMSGFFVCVYVMAFNPPNDPEK